MENNMVTIPVNQYEEMIRDQRTLEMITALIQVSFVGEDQLRALCGLQPKGDENLNKLFAAEPGKPEPLPAGCPKAVPCGKPAIMIENVEDPPAKPAITPPPEKKLTGANCGPCITPDGRRRPLRRNWGAQNRQYQ